MNKALMWTSITVFGLVGAYIPVLLFKASDLSVWSILGGIIGSFAGIWVAMKLNDYVA